MDTSPSPSPATDPQITGPAADPAAPPAGPGGLVFWAGAAAGAALVAFGIRGLLLEERDGAPSAARWFIGGALVVDLLVIPVGAALGWLAKRAVPARSWPIVRAALFTSVILIAFAAPLVLGEGGVPGNPTIRPRDYGSGLAAALVVVWAMAALVLGAQRMRRRSAPATG